MMIQIRDILCFEKHCQKDNSLQIRRVFVLAEREHDARGGPRNNNYLLRSERKPSKKVAK